MQRRGLSDEFQAKHHRISSERSREFVDEAFVRERGLRGVYRAPGAYGNRRLCHDVFDPKVRRSIGYVIRRLGLPFVQTALNVLRLPPPFPLLAQSRRANAMIPGGQSSIRIKTRAHEVAARRPEMIVGDVVFTRV